MRHRPILSLIALLLLLTPGTTALLPHPSVNLVSTDVGARTEAAPHVGLSALDVTWTLERLARGDVPLDVLAPLATGEAVAVPPEVRARLESPPPFLTTLSSLAAGSPSAQAEDVRRAQDLLRGRPLPPDLDRALSTLGQGALAAQAFAHSGDAMTGAAVAQAALDLARPTLLKHAILLRNPDAYTGWAWDASGTDHRVTRTLAAHGAADALAVWGLAPTADTPVAAPLSQQLADLYARLGLPVDIETRVALAASDALDPALRTPLSQALAHVLAAHDAREAAFAGLGVEDRAVLGRASEIELALRAPAPTPAQLELLARYGEAVGAIDRDLLLRGEAELLRAATVLDEARLPGGGFAVPLSSPASVRDGAAHPRSPSQQPIETSVSIGSLRVDVGTNGRGDVVLRVREDDARPAPTVSAPRAVFDRSTGSIVLYDDRDGDGAPLHEEIVFESPPLAAPTNDILFQDPYGLVVVSGDGATLTDASLGGRRVLLDLAPTPEADPLGAQASALDGFDAALDRQPTFGAWPYASDSTRDALLGARDALGLAGRELLVTVNPQGYQVLRWDLGGDDAYLTNAGGAGSDGLLAVDGGGASRLVRPEALRQPLPAALLVDRAGNDTYETRDAHTLASANMSLALLVDGGGRDRFAFLGDARGLASATGGGVAILLTASGDTTYAAGDHALGHAEAGGLAFLLDAGGDDAYSARNESLAASSLGHVALLHDAQGNDTYRSANFSQAATRGGLAFLVESGGNDTYRATVALTSQGYAQPYDESELPCPAEEACPAALGPARIAVLADLGGADTGTCGEGSATNAAVGRVGLRRPPLPGGPFNPAFGACLDVDLDPRHDRILRLDGEPRAEVPPTFFVSSFGNFTLPGLVRLGSFGDDLVLDPFLLQVDLAGNDTYALGAVAAVNASRVRFSDADHGLVAPVSLLVDVDGANVYDAALARGYAGAFGHADGGVALHATLSADRAALTTDAAARDNLTRPQDQAPNATRLQGGTLRNATQLAALRPVVASSTYVNVSVGLGAAENGGVALVLSEGVTNVVLGAPDYGLAASCRLACARSGGVALYAGNGGLGDTVNVTPYSLGGVFENPAGGAALYYKRGPADTYDGSNLSMGYVARPPGAAAEDPLADVGARPHVALFVDDGWAYDSYHGAMLYPGLERAPRGDDRTWEDARMAEAFQVSGNRTLRVGMGVDNLDWYLNFQVASADRGVGADLGPSDPLQGRARPAYLPYQVGPTQPGNGDSVTGPDGVRPVTLARTAFSPLVNVTGMRAGYGSGVVRTPDQVPFIGDKVQFLATIANPPAYADSTVLHEKDLTNQSQLGTANAIEIVELVVEGTSARWQGCPVLNMTDRVDPRKCIVARWDRQVDPPTGSDNVQPVRETLQGGEFLLNWTPSASLLDSAAASLMFPPGPYVVAVRAFAARDWGVPGNPYGIEAQLLDPLASDALNHTDDSYGFYGSTYALSLPVLPRPINSVPRLIDSDGTRPVVLETNVTEPGVWNATVVSLATGARACIPAPCRANRPVGNFPTPHYGDAEGYTARGNDFIRVEWDARGWPVGAYALSVTFRGEITGIQTTFFPEEVYVDDVATANGLLPQALPAGALITSDEAPDGGFTLTVFDVRSDGSGPSPLQTVHLWVQEDVLDAADPRVILESLPWRHVALNATGSDALRPARVFLPDENRTVFAYNHTFPGDPNPGAPRTYRFAAYLEDRAGNVRVAEPNRTAPTAPDCLGGRCAQVFFDITPPRTRLALVDPAPDLARTRGGNLTFSLDASETPDVAGIQLYGLAIAASQSENLSAATFGLGETANASKSRHVRLDPLPGGRLVQGEDSLVVENGTFSLRGTITNLAGQTFDALRPLWLAVDLHRDDGTRLTATPYLFNVSEQLLFLNPDTTVTVTLDGIPAPAAGLYRATVGVEHNLTPVETWLTDDNGAPILNATGQRIPLHPSFHMLPASEPFVVWRALPQSATGTPGWAPTANDLQHGATLFAMSRGVDRVGNVERKVDFDVRVDVDLVAPSLLAPPTVRATSNDATLTLDTDEPATATLVLFDADGLEVARVPAGAPGRLATQHVARSPALDPDTPYRYEVVLEDAVGNAATLTDASYAFRTAQTLLLNVTPLPALVDAPLDFTWIAERVDDPYVTYNLSLSLDGGATYPVSLTPNGIALFEGGNATRTFRLDPAQLPESPQARLRLESYRTERPDLRSATLTGTFTLDGRAPTVTAEGDAGLVNWTNGSAVLTVNATDAGTGVALVEWSRDNATYTPVAGPLRFDGPLPTEIRLRARDHAGHVSAPVPVRVLVDSRAPTLTATLPQGNSTRGGHVAVYVEALDEGAGIARIEATQGELALAPLLADDLRDGRGILLWPVGLDEGHHTLELTAVDKAGNTATAHVEVRLDRQPPTPILSTGGATVDRLAATVEVDEPARLEATLVGPFGTVRHAAPAFSQLHALDFRGLVPGMTYELRVEVVDAAGNRATTSTRLATQRDTTAPSSVVGLGVEPHGDGTLTLTWRPATDDVGIERYEVVRAARGEAAKIVGETRAPTFVDTTATAGESYSYRVHAVDASGNRGAESAVAFASPRTAPTVLDVETAAQDGTVRFAVRVLDPDGDRPQVRVVLADRTVPLAVVGRDADGAWRLEGAAQLPPARLGDDSRRYHVEATDGLFEARAPAFGSHRVVAEATEPESAWILSAAARVPGATLPLLAAALAAGAALVHVRHRRNQP